MANWVIKAYEDLLSKLWDSMHRKLLECDVIHCDESKMQVLDEPGRGAEMESRMWVYRTGEYMKIAIILFEYQQTRHGAHARAFLDDENRDITHTKYIITDDFGGYNKVKNYIRCDCWQHVRSKFFAAIPKDEQKEENKSISTYARQGVEYCDRLFTIEDELKELTPEDRKQERLKRLKPAIDAFYEWMASLDPLQKFGLGKAIAYAVSNKTLLLNFLLDGRIPISNNLAENAVRPFALGRKNWEFAKCVNGAKASAVVYSVVETAKANGIDPLLYLIRLLRLLPAALRNGTVPDWDLFMPWHPDVVSACSKR
jgi:transposase-like protein